MTGDGSRRTNDRPAVAARGCASRLRADHARPRHRYCARGLLGRRARQQPRHRHRERDAGHVTRPRRSAHAADRARHGSAPTSNSPSSTASPSPPAPAASPGCASALSAARGIALAAGKPAVGLSTLAGFAAPLIAEDDSTHVVAAIDARHDHVYLQVFGAGGRTLVAPRIATLRDAVRAAMTGPARIIGSAAGPVGGGLAEREPSQPLLVEQSGAPESVGSRGSAPRRQKVMVRRSRSICARPTPSRRTPPACRADDRPHLPPVRARRSRAVRSRTARRRRHGRTARRFIPSRLERARIRAVAARSQCRRTSRLARRQPRRIHPVADRGGEAEILSIAVACSRRGRGLARTAARSPLAPACRTWRAHRLSRSGRSQYAGAPALSARRLPRRRPPGRILSRREGAPALVLRRDLA